MISSEQISDLLRVYRLAHLRNQNSADFIDMLEKVYSVDINTYPKNSDGEIVYPDGKIGIDINLSQEEELVINAKATDLGITFNEFCIMAVNEALQKIEKEKND